MHHNMYTWRQELKAPPKCAAIVHLGCVACGEVLQLCLACFGQVASQGAIVHLLYLHGPNQLANAKPATSAPATLG